MFTACAAGGKFKTKNMKILIDVNFIEHGRLVLTNEKGDTYNSRSEELIDFFHGLKDSSQKEPETVHGNEAEKEVCEHPT